MPDQHIVDLSHCIQVQHNIGSDAYFNICDGTTHAVSWGAADWIGITAISLIFVMIFALFAGLIYAMVTE